MYFLLADFLHTLDPYFIKLWEGGPIRWYGLSYLFGFFLGYLLIRRVARCGISTLKPDHIPDLVVGLAIAIVIGGRLGYVLFYSPKLLVDFSSDFPFWGVIAINRGGMASHGGILGFIVGTYIFARRNKHAWSHLLDIGAFAAPLGLAFGRVANFINGELLGRPASPDLVWAVRFPQEIFSWPAERQIALIDQLEQGGIKTHGDLGHVVAMVQAKYPTVIEIIRPMLTPRHPSQLYQALLEGLSVFIILAIVWMKPRRPLIIGSTFCIAYGVMRIIGEQFREPDAHIRAMEYAHWGITRGQWLSVLLVLLGLIGYVVVHCRKDAPHGGWRGPCKDATEEKEQADAGA